LCKKIYSIEMEVAGNTAMWTRPDCGDSPCSYPAPTYCAVRALFESVLWGPAVIIKPTRVELCSPPRYHSYVTNYGGPLRSSQSLKAGNNYQLYATVLINVCYKLHAIVVPNPVKDKLPEKARLWDNRTTCPAHAYQEIFNRRLSRGQSFATLSLGWSEFTVSYFGPFRKKTHVCEDIPEIKIPSMLREIFSDGYNSAYNPVYDTGLSIKRGVLEYPERGKICD
jgi:CRISPR-associated protein Cas5d